MTLEKHYGLEDKALETVKFKLFGTVCHVWITCGNSGYSCEPQFPLKTDIQTCLALPTKKTLLKDVDITSIILETKTFEVTKLISSFSFCYMKKYNFPLQIELNPQIVTAEDILAKLRVSISLGLLQVSFLVSVYISCLTPRLPPAPLSFLGLQIQTKTKSIADSRCFCISLILTRNQSGPNKMKWCLGITLGFKMLCRP